MLARDMHCQNVSYFLSAAPRREMFLDRRSSHFEINEIKDFTILIHFHKIGETYVQGIM